jgi:REP element-mobilizing transposase RayT
MDVEIIEAHVCKDHLYLLMSVPQHFTVSKLSQGLKKKHPANC